MMIDAGMTRSKAKGLVVDGAGVKLVFAGQKDGPPGEGPFSSRTRWQPVFIVEMNDRKICRAIDNDQSISVSRQSGDASF